MALSPEKTTSIKSTDLRLLTASTAFWCYACPLSICGQAARIAASHAQPPTASTASQPTITCSSPSVFCFVCRCWNWTPLDRHGLL